MSLQKIVNTAKNQLLGKNFLASKCDAQRRSYGGSLYPQYVFCSRPKRKGCRTCWQHAKMETPE